MGKILASSGVALSGLVTSFLTAVIVTVFHLWTGFNFFTFSLWVVLPVGAGLCGFAAASGYFLAAKYLHQKPTAFLLVQMVVIAAVTQFLIYWLEYRTMVVEGENVSSFIGFSDYLNITLTHAHMKIGRALSGDIGEVGSFGYWLAVIDFIGFLIGGACVYIYLMGEPTCTECKKYLRAAVKKKDTFEDIEQLSAYYDHVYANPVDSAEFTQHVGTCYTAPKTETGTINCTTVVFECPQCFGQSVQETVSVFNGRDWKDVADLKRFIAMPAGVDVRPAFR